MKAFDIAIGGCGPGGLASALFLQRLGHSVTLFERFEEPHPVGSGLLVQPSGIAVLEELGLARDIRSQGARVDFLKGTDIISGKRALDVDYRALKGEQCAFGVHRSLLFRTLYNAVKTADTAIETDMKITGSDIVSDGRRQLLFDGGDASKPFDCVINALGARTTLAPPTGHILPFGAFWATLDWPEGAGFPADALDQRYRRAREMAGVLPIGINPATGRRGAAFFWSLKPSQVDAFHARGLAEWRDEVLALWPETEVLLDQISSTHDMIFAQYRHRTVSTPVDGSLVHLGDAWHSTSPQLGQGANMALLDAAAIGVAFQRHESVEDALAHYAWLRQSHVRLYQAMSAFFTPLYQADDAIRPFVRDNLVHWFGRLWPAKSLIAAIVSGNLGWPLRPMGLSKR